MFKQVIYYFIAVVEEGSFSKATSEGMVTFGTTVTQGYLGVPVSDFSSLTGRKPLSIQYIFEHVDDYLLGDRHPR